MLLRHPGRSPARSPLIKETKPVGVMIPQAAFAPCNDVVNAGYVSVDDAHEYWRTVRSLAEWNGIPVESGFQ